MGFFGSPAFAFLLAGVVLNAAAQLFLKAGTHVTGVITPTRDNWWPTLLTVLHTAAFPRGHALLRVSLVIWIIGLSRVPVSVAYPLLSIGYLINAIGAHYLLGEAVSLSRWMGIGLMILGVLLVGRSA